jgi:hypothetical protein
MADDALALAVTKIIASWGSRVGGRDESETADIQGLEIAIGAHPGGLSMESDVRLVKAAILYGDRATLYSPAASLLTFVGRLDGLDEDGKLGFLQDITNLLEPASGPQVEAVIRTYRELRGRKHRQPNEIKQVGLLRTQLLRDAWATMIQETNVFLDTTGIAALRPAVAAGLLRIDPLLAGREYDEELFTLAFVERLGAILNDRRAYPLFDQQTGELVEASIAAGIFGSSETADRRGRQASAASGFLDKLPAFPNASVAEVLDIRKELGRPLAAFRSGVARLAELIESPSYSGQFDEEIQEIYVRDVAPALAEIDELVRANRDLVSLLGSSAGDLKTMLTGVITFAVARGMHTSDLIAGGVAGVAAVLRAAADVKAEGRRIKANQFYFLYQTQELLAGD